MSQHSPSSAAASRGPRILLVSANGQVGWELHRSLRPLGEVVATVHSPTNDPSLHGLVSLNLSDEHAVRALVQAIRPDVIVNAAAYSAVDRAESQAELAMSINGIAPGILASEAALLGAAIIHYSTDYVFDGSGTAAWQIDSPTRPLNAYGRSKLVGEVAVRNSGAAHLIMRTSWVYGAHGLNFVKTMLKLGATREEIRVVNDQIGAPTSARVIADVTAQILGQGIHDPCGMLRERGGTMHMCCGGETNWYQFAEEIFRLARGLSLPLAVKQLVPIASAEYPTPAQRPKNSRLDCSRVTNVFSLRPPAWQVALRDSFTALAKDLACSA